MIKLLLFDNNGVLTTNDKERTYRRISTFLGVSQKRIKQVYLKIAPRLDDGTITEDQFCEQTLTQLGKPDVSIKKYRSIRNHSYISKPAMQKLALQLKKRYRVALLTNFGDMFHEANKRWKLNRIFKSQDIFLSCEIGMKKPDTKFFRYAIKKLKCKPQEILFIDDNLDNCKAASKMGIRTHLFTKKHLFMRALKNMETSNTER